MSLTTSEIDSQPAIWRTALERTGTQARQQWTRPGQRMLVLGCGTSAFVAESFALLRESAGLGHTDAGYASEPRPWRDYDSVLALTRSGTTTEVLDALRALPPGVRRLAVTGVPDSPVAELVDDLVDLSYADESSVVQTRFPTTLLLLARAAFGADVAALPDEAESRLAHPLGLDVSAFEHFVYLGSGWTYGLAQEAALKIREAAQAWAESYPTLDYRHGPLAVATERTLVWMIGRSDPDLVATVEATGATVRTSTGDPLVELVDAQRLAVALAGSRGLDPDHPRHLTRSIVLA